MLINLRYNICDRIAYCRNDSKYEGRILDVNYFVTDASQRREYVVREYFNQDGEVFSREASVPENDIYKLIAGKGSTTVLINPKFNIGDRVGRSEPLLRDFVGDVIGLDAYNCFSEPFFWYAVRNGDRVYRCSEVAIIRISGGGDASDN